MISIKVKSAFLLTLLLTAGFVTVDARRLNNVKVQKLKQDLGGDKAMPNYPATAEEDVKESIKLGAVQDHLDDVRSHDRSDGDSHRLSNHTALMEEEMVGDVSGSLVETGPFLCKWPLRLLSRQMGFDDNLEWDSQNGQNVKVHTHGCCMRLRPRAASTSGNDTTDKGGGNVAAHEDIYPELSEELKESNVDLVATPNDGLFLCRAFIVSDDECTCGDSNANTHAKYQQWHRPATWSKSDSTWKVWKTTHGYSFNSKTHAMAVGPSTLTDMEKYVRVLGENEVTMNDFPVGTVVKMGTPPGEELGLVSGYSFPAAGGNVKVEVMLAEDRAASFEHNDLTKASGTKQTINKIKAKYHAVPGKGNSLCHGQNRMNTDYQRKVDEEKECKDQCSTDDRCKAFRYDVAEWDWQCTLYDSKEDKEQGSVAWLWDCTEKVKPVDEKKAVSPQDRQKQLLQAVDAFVQKDSSEPSSIEAHAEEKERLVRLGGSEDSISEEPKKPERDVGADEAMPNDPERAEIVVEEEEEVAPAGETKEESKEETKEETNDKTKNQVKEGRVQAEKGDEEE